MVLSAAFAVLVGGTIPSRRQMGLREVLDISTPEGLKSLIKAVTAATLVTELLGALVLFWLARSHIPVVNERLWWSIFHAISAFCNAGISLSSTSLADFVNDSTLCLVFMVLITIGGIGFFVISDLMDSEVWVVKKPKAVWARLQIQTKVVLIATIILNSLGMLLFLFFEYDGALHGLPAGQKIVASLFHAISLRSAGFSLVPMDGLSAPAVLFSIGFMFIGASPGSTGGGIKTTTAAISVMALRAMLRGREEVEILGRRMATQDIRFDKLFFEAVSAFGTVGLSMDTTTSLNNTGRLIIICLMYVGRIGPLTMALAIGEKKFAQGYQLPRGRIAVG
jgi:trk system potassium uptake protein TrkH